MQNQSGLPPGPKGLPLLGNVLAFRHDQLSYLLQHQHAYGRTATIYVGKTPIILLFRLDHVRYVLTEHPANFTNREVAGGLVYGNLLIFSLLARHGTDKVSQGLHEVLGDGLLTTDGSFHDQQRRLLQPAFSLHRVASTAPTVVRYTRELVATWQPGGEVNLVREMQGLLLRIMTKFFVDIDMLGERAEWLWISEGLLNQPTGIFEGLLNLQLDLPFTPYGRRMALKRRADGYIYQIIEQRLAERGDRGDVLSMLLSNSDEQGAGMSLQQVRDELIALLAAGHETTVNVLAWTFYLLSEHPGVLDRVLTELQTQLAGRDLQMEDLPRLTYLDWVGKESMRLYPSGWTQGRHAREAFDPARLKAAPQATLVSAGRNADVSLNQRRRYE